MKRLMVVAMLVEMAAIIAALVVVSRNDITIAKLEARVEAQDNEIAELKAELDQAKSTVGLPLHGVTWKALTWGDFEGCMVGLLNDLGAQEASEGTTGDIAIREIGKEGKPLLHIRYLSRDYYVAGNVDDQQFARSLESTAVELSRVRLASLK